MGPSLKTDVSYERCPVKYCEIIFFIGTIATPNVKYKCQICFNVLPT